ncbi:hypothetical protein EPUL_006842, partial [Erysiphe pulchra]
MVFSLIKTNAKFNKSKRRALVPNLTSELYNIKEVAPKLWESQILDKLGVYVDDSL